MSDLMRLLEAASEALADQSGMVVCWHEYRDENALLASGCPQCLVDTALADLRREEAIRGRRPLTVYDVACHYCRAAVGEMCRTSPTGIERVTPHALRVHAYRATITPTKEGQDG